ncbi:M4 family metallopeptidase [Streptacidiphilus sp. ASG 303]|uniref:M4 family metallopeptidase n=1 Tax=Streptacidiphilus sp. ASG 303 TaxID=2896847 RepID=UPI001E5E21E2|nr:M4 family metallopeptidase [Streptacidiphilus sp. ASG 303]MCD0484014.1 M4 family metallopeptidase [Streptacidiphilus sp. ASG 303]
MRRTRIRGVIVAAAVVAATGSALLVPPAWADGADTAPRPPGRTAVPVAPTVTEGLDRTVRGGSPADAARSHLRDHQDVYRIADSDLRTLGTTGGGGHAAVRFQQLHHGVPVFGAQYAVQTEKVDGGQRVESTTGTLYTALTVPTTPLVDRDTARRRAFVLDRRLADVEDARTADHGLTVLPGADGGRLAWHFTVTGAAPDGGPVRQEVFVDARVGGIALSYDNVETLDAGTASPVQGTGVRFDGSETPVAANREADGSYTLVDSTRPMYATARGQIRTFDAQRLDYNAVTGGGVPDGIPPASSASTRFDGAQTASGAVDAHVNAAKVYQYYLQEIGRDGLDGKGGTIDSVVNVSSKGKDFYNAFWDGSKMVYGSNKGIPLSVALDVVGHEMTHGVTEHAAGLVYLNQSGALNEAVSDYFGNAMETADKGIAMDDPDSGLVGEYLCNGTKTLRACALRDMNDGRSAQKDYIPATLDVDNGGVHDNSTVVSGAMWDVRKRLDHGLADRIMYLAAQDYLTPLSGFTDMRHAVTLAAKALKASKDDLQAIGDAFDAHGIVDGWEQLGGVHDGTALAAGVVPAYELTSGVDEQAAQVDGDVYAVGHGDAVAWSRGGAAFGITVGRFGKQAGESDHELAEDGAYLVDPSLDDDRVVFTRIAPDGVGVYTADDKGQGAVKKLVDGPDDEIEPVTDHGSLAWIGVSADGERDVYLRTPDGTTTDLTPEAGTAAGNLAMKHGRLAWRDGKGRYLHVYDTATGTARSTKIQFFLLNSITDIQITGDRVFWRESGGFIFPGSYFYSAPLDDPAHFRVISQPSPYSLHGAQFSVNEDYFVYSTYDAYGSLGSWTGKVGKVWAAPVADVVAGTPVYTRVSCSSGYQLAPSLGDGQRTVWLDTTAASTDVVTRGSFAGTCS